MSIQLATTLDAEAIQAIYAPFCTDTSITFETTPPSVASMQQRIHRVTEQYPWLVYTHRNQVLGYVYATTHNERAAYQWSVNVSVYIHPNARRKGIGQGLYTSLFAILRLQGYYNAYAGITLPNPASMGLHQTMGFQPVGNYRHVGYKCGKWHDVTWLELALQTPTANPNFPISIQELIKSKSNLFIPALNSGLSLIK